MKKLVSLIVFVVLISSFSAQTVLLEDFNVGSAYGNVNSTFNYNGDQYVVCSNGVNGNEIFLFDGTNRTLMDETASGSSGSSISKVIEFQNKIYFSASDGVNGYELFSFDGVTTEMVADINPSGSSQPGNFTIYQNELYFTANDGSIGNELWKFDGLNVSLVEDIVPGSTGSSALGFIVLGSDLIFYGTYPGSGIEMLKYDGSSVSLLADINPGTSGAFIYEPILFNGIIYFRAYNSTYGSELYSYDGSSVQLFADIETGSLNSSPEFFFEFNGELYFSASTSSTGKELFKTDGNTVSLVEDINPGSSGSNPNDYIEYNGTLCFSANNGASGLELFQYDGSSVQLVEDLNIGTASAGIQDGFVFDNKLYFSATNGSFGNELYQYNGSEVVLIEDINVGSSGSTPQDFFEYNGYLFFNATDGTHGMELYRYDGCSLGAYLDEFVCGNTYSVPSGDESYIVSGDYLDTIPSINGCDSILRIHLVLANDFVGPTPDLTNLPIITSQCAISSLSAPTATDNCSGSVSGILTSSLPISQLGSTIVFWQYEDLNGNITLQSQEINIIDTIQPNLVITDVTGYLDEDGEFILSEIDYDVNSNDGCGNYVLSTSKSYFDCSDIGMNAVTVMILDEANNDSSDVITVEILDTLAPVPYAANLADIVALHEVNVLYPPVVSDNCGFVTVSNDAVLPITNDTIILWTYTDQYGNVSSQEQVVEVLEPQFSGVSSNENEVWKIFPNPAHGFTNITVDRNGELMILDQLGRVLYTDVVSKQLNLNLSNFAAGKYIIKFSSENSVSHKVLVVQ
ncbi:MAG: T9SS type A sorting domain-containing protein [Flavobacteriales bacterium]|nr:T9SS type A sorting domain-containing protein [Flavobacteriales bacterium]